MSVVKVFGAHWCPPCKSLKAALRKRGIEYDYLEEEEHADVHEEHEIDAIPQVALVIDGVMRLFPAAGSELAASEWGLLQDAQRLAVCNPKTRACSVSEAALGPSLRAARQEWLEDALFQLTSSAVADVLRRGKQPVGRAKAERCERLAGLIRSGAVRGEAVVGALTQLDLEALAAALMAGSVGMSGPELKRRLGRMLDDLAARHEAPHGGVAEASSSV